jgi:hypothetical protein
MLRGVPEAGPPGGVWHTLGAVAWDGLLQTVREARDSPLVFCLGSVSVLIVVFVAAVLSTLLANAPVMFLRESETTWGQADVRMSLATGTDFSYVNYSDIAARLDAAGPRMRAENPAAVDDFDDYSFHAPRLIMFADLQRASSCIVRARRGAGVEGRGRGVRGGRRARSFRRACRPSRGRRRCTRLRTRMELGCTGRPRARSWRRRA